MHGVNLALRFLLELAGIVALGYWGWQASTPPARYALAIAAPAALIAVWALVVAPNARNPVPRAVRMVLGSGLLVGTAVALAAAGQPVAAAVLGALVVLNTALLLAWDEPRGA